VKATPVTAEAVGLVRVTVSTEAAPSVIVLGAKDFAAEGVTTMRSSSLAELV